MKTIILFLSCLFGLLTIFAQSNQIEGRYKQIDDKTGKMKSIIELSIQNGKLYGTIEEIFVEKNRNQRCTNCSGDQKNHPLIGLKVIIGMENTGSEWYNDDSILDPGSGRTFTGKVWVEEPGIIKVRGYLGALYRTQTWYKIN